MFKKKKNLSILRFSKVLVLATQNRGKTHKIRKMKKKNIETCHVIVVFQTACGIFITDQLRQSWTGVWW